ncbi:WD repeat domain-containing protein 83-like [Ornithodoros turicata]|uniref:WD repeat domain-containing protein 83-like n=1 Tax=Ornithodoros turicata TaxID=34597 RepID=UPI00313A4A05
MGVPTVNTRQLDCKQGAVRTVRFNVDGNYCMTGGSDRTIKLWNPFRGALLLQTFLGHGGDVFDVRGSCDNAMIVSAGSDKTVVLWDVSTGRATRKIRGHAGSVQTVCFNEDSTVAISGSQDSTVRTWDLRSRARDPIQVLDQARDAVTSVCVSDHEIVCTSLDGCVRRYDLRQGQLAVDTVGSPATRALITRDGLCLLVATLGKQACLRLLDKSSGELLQEFKGHRNEEYYVDCAMSEDDAIVYTGSEDGSLYCWNLVEGKLLEKLEHPTKGAVHSVSHHPKRSDILTATGKLVYLWQLKPLPSETLSVEELIGPLPKMEDT